MATSAEPVYRPLTEQDLNLPLFLTFQRYQQVTHCWRKIRGKWVIKKVPFVEHWGKEEMVILLGYLENTLLQGGALFGAILPGPELAGFVSLEGERCGPEQEYLQLSSLHVSHLHRGKGIGGTLFHLAAGAARERGAEKLYISGHSAVETQGFYQAQGCVDTTWIHPELYQKEPMDRHLEYLL